MRGGGAGSVMTRARAGNGWTLCRAINIAKRTDSAVFPRFIHAGSRFRGRRQVNPTGLGRPYNSLVKGVSIRLVVTFPLHACVGFSGHTDRSCFAKPFFNFHWGPTRHHAQSSATPQHGAAAVRVAPGSQQTQKASDTRNGRPRCEGSRQVTQGRPRFRLAASRRVQGPAFLLLSNAPLLRNFFQILYIYIFLIY
jgi:hypothetical protein